MATILKKGKSHTVVYRHPETKKQIWESFKKASFAKGRKAQVELCIFKKEAIPSKREFEQTYTDKEFYEPTVPTVSHLPKNEILQLVTSNIQSSTLRIRFRIRC